MWQERQDRVTSVSGQFWLLQVRHLLSQRCSVLVLYCLKHRSQKYTAEKKAGDVGNGVKVAKSFVVHQVQIEDGPVLGRVVGDPDKLVAQRRRHDRHPILEELFESGQIIEGPGTIDGDAGFLAY